MRNPRVVRGGWLAGLPVPVARQVIALTASRSGGSRRWRHGWWMRTRTVREVMLEATLVHYGSGGTTIAGYPVMSHGEPVPPFTADMGADDAGR